MPDVVELIKTQHRLMDDLLEQAMQEGTDTLALLRQVSAMLLPHSHAEESFVYPAIEKRDAQEAEEVADGTAEHHHIEQLMLELLAEDPDGPGYDGKLAAMVAELRHHVEEEEQDLLPVLSEKASAEERERMGARFAAETGGAGADRVGTDSTDLTDLTRDELYEKAKQQEVPGRSTMTKDELTDAVDAG